jgi:hypothetical protein
LGCTCLEKEAGEKHQDAKEKTPVNTHQRHFLPVRCLIALHSTLCASHKTAGEHPNIFEASSKTYADSVLWYAKHTLENIHQVT